MTLLLLPLALICDKNQYVSLTKSTPQRPRTLMNAPHGGCPGHLIVKAVTRLLSVGCQLEWVTQDGPRRSRPAAELF